MLRARHFRESRLITDFKRSIFITTWTYKRDACASYLSKTPFNDWKSSAGCMSPTICLSPVRWRLRRIYFARHTSTLSLSTTTSVREVSETK